MKTVKRLCALTLFFLASTSFAQDFKLILAIFDIATRTTTIEIEIETDGEESIDEAWWLADDSAILTRIGKKLSLWDSRTGEQIYEIVEEDFFYLQWSPQQDYFITYNCNFRVYNAYTGEKLLEGESPP